MKLNIQTIEGPWDKGYTLDKHIVQSTYLGDNQQGHATFDTTRTEIGQALYLLKYKQDMTQVTPIADAILSTAKTLGFISAVIPMPASTLRRVQPVEELAKQVAIRGGLFYLDNLLVKTGAGAKMKDLSTAAEKADALKGSLAVNDVLSEGKYVILIIDDLFDTGSSFTEATSVLRKYSKISQIYVIAATRKRN